MHTVAVIGAGATGRGFAIACAAAGFSVVLEDVMPEKLRNAAAAFAQMEHVRSGYDMRLVSTVEDAVRDADLVVDFVPDELESKLEIWSMIDRMAPPKTVLCTPSQALSITDLASCTYRADRCVMARGTLTGSGGLHLLSARDTSGETLSMASGLFSALGYQVVLEADPDLPMLLKNMRAVAI